MNMKSSIAVAFLAAGALFTAAAQPLSIEQAMREACTASDSVKMMRQTVEKSRQAVREGWSNAFPIIAASASAARAHGSLFGSSGGGGSSSRVAKTASLYDRSYGGGASYAAAGPGPNDPVTWGELGNMFSAFSEAQNTTVYSASLNATQPIFTFGKIGTAIKVARQYDQSTRSVYRRSIQTLQLTAFDAFSNAVQAEKASAIAERSMARKKEINDFQERNFQLGAGAKAQLLAVRGEVSRQHAAAIIARRDAQNARMYLNAFLGRTLTDSSAFDTVSVPGALLAASPASAEETVRSSVETRSDLQALRYIADANRGGAKIYRANYLPSIAASGSLGYSKYESGSSIMNNNGMSSWTIGIGASWTLFDGFANSARAAQYASDAEKFDILHGQLSKMVEIEIRSAIAECRAADSNVAAANETFAAADEAYRLTSDDFKQGKGQFADLLLADEQLQGAELGLINARYRQLRSRAAMLVSMGKDIITIQ